MQIQYKILFCHTERTKLK